MIYNHEESKGTTEIIFKDKYENGRYMYNLFPDVIKYSFGEKIERALRINLFKFETMKEKNAYNLEINSLRVELDKNSYIPILYTEGDNNDNSRMHFKIEFDCVENKDLEI